MAGYLVDTSITSMFAPGRPDVPADFATWMRARNVSLYLSTITVFEATQGIAKLERQGASERARRLAIWLDGLVVSFGPRVLCVDDPIARAGGKLADRAISIGRHPGAPDILIAATATAHDLVLLTRNARHFAPLGIDVLDPLVSLPD